MIPPYLLETLRSISNGEDIHFCLGHLSDKASAYVSRLKARGLAYTHRSGGTTEVWRTEKGERLLASKSRTEEAK